MIGLGAVHLRSQDAPFKGTIRSFLIAVSLLPKVIVLDFIAIIHDRAQLVVVLKIVHKIVLVAALDFVEAVESTRVEAVPPLESKNQSLWTEVDFPYSWILGEHLHDFLQPFVLVPYTKA